MKPWFQDNDIEIYSAHSEGKSVVLERFIKTLKNKIYTHTTSISKNVYIDKLDNVVNEYKNTYYSITEMKPANVKASIDIDFGIEKNEKDPKFKVGDQVGMSKYKKTFLRKVVLQIDLRKFLCKKKLKILCHEQT